MGNYASIGDSYTKGESDDNYPSKTVFNTAINARYTKTESDTKFQPKGDYATIVDFENKIKSFPTIDNVYTKTESDTKFQPKGNYSLLGDSYKKAESDTAIKTINDNLAAGLAGRYTKAESDATIKTVNDNLAAGLAARYTKAESDATIKTVNDNLAAGLAARYTKAESDAAIKAGNDGLAARYTKTESDARYPSLAAYNAAIQAGNALVGNNIYTKSESDARYPALATYNTAMTDRYTKVESDARYPALATYNSAIKTVNDNLAAGLAARYTKGESDATIKTVNDNLAAGLAARYTKTEVDNKVTSDIKTKSMWCADGEICTIPVGKKGFTNGSITIDNNTITNNKTGEAGRMHISGNERLYLLNKDGVIIGKEWGGNGNLQVQGRLITGSQGISNTMVGPFKLHFFSKGGCLAVDNFGDSGNGGDACHGADRIDKHFYWNPATGQIISAKYFTCLDTNGGDKWTFNPCSDSQHQQFVKESGTIKSISTLKCLDTGNTNRSYNCDGNNSHQKVRFVSNLNFYD